MHIGPDHVAIPVPLFQRMMKVYAIYEEQYNNLVAQAQHQNDEPPADVQMPNGAPGFMEMMDPTAGMTPRGYAAEKANPSSEE